MSNPDGKREVFASLPPGQIIRGAGFNPMAGRMSGKAVLEDRIRRLRVQADRLESLLKSLPDLEGEADEALWQIVCDIGRPHS